MFIIHGTQSTQLRGVLVRKLPHAQLSLAVAHTSCAANIPATQHVYMHAAAKAVAAADDGSRKHCKNEEE